MMDYDLSRVSESHTQLLLHLLQMLEGMQERVGDSTQEKTHVSETMPSKRCPCRSIPLCLVFSKSLERKSDQTARNCKLLIPWVQYNKILEADLQECSTVGDTESHNLNIKVQNSSSNTQSY